MTEIQGCNAVINELATGTGWVKANWSSTFYPQAYRNLTLLGRKPIAGPMLVLQGEADEAVPFLLIIVVVNYTCENFEGQDIEYLTLENVTHVPVLYASKRIWLQWIRERFEEKEVEAGCRTRRLESARPYEYYQAEVNWYFEFSEEGYETA